MAEAKVTTVTDDNNGENKIIGDCNYHLCKKEKIEVQICLYCKKEFCSDHINPKVPMQPDFKDSKQFYEWKDGVNYHPCPDYYDYLREQERFGIHQRNGVFDRGKKRQPIQIIRNENIRTRYVWSVDDTDLPTTENQISAKAKLPDREKIKQKNDGKEIRNKCSFCSIESNELIECEYCRMRFCKDHSEPKTRHEFLRTKGGHSCEKLPPFEENEHIIPKKPLPYTHSDKSISRSQVKKLVKIFLVAIIFILLPVAAIISSGMLGNITLFNNDGDKLIGTWEGAVSSRDGDIVKIEFKPYKQACWWYSGGGYSYKGDSYDLQDKKLMLIYYGSVDTQFFYELVGETLYLNGNKFIRSENNFIQKFESNLSIDNYVAMCELVRPYVIEETPHEYTGRNVTMNGTIKGIYRDGNFTVYMVTDYQEYGYQGFTYIATDEQNNLGIDDALTVWGKIQGQHTFNDDTLSYIWAVLIKRIYDRPDTVPNQVYQDLYNELGWINPSYMQMINFIHTDRTDLHPYSDTFTCVQFSNTLIEHARQCGYQAWDVTIYPTATESYSSGTNLSNVPPSHMIVCFNTSDKGLYFVESQSDDIFTKQEFERLQSSGRYPICDMDFNHYKINYDAFYPDWDAYSCSWIFHINDQTYVIQNR